jgi:hypothetical protein
MHEEKLLERLKTRFDRIPLKRGSSYEKKSSLPGGGHGYVSDNEAESEFKKLLSELWDYLEGSNIFKSILAELEQDPIKVKLEKYFKKRYLSNIQDLNVVVDPDTILLEPENEYESLVRSYIVIKSIVKANPIEWPNLKIKFSSNKLEEYKNRLYIFLKETIEDNYLVLYWLERYKHKCEWFSETRAKLLKLENDNDGINKERSLAYHLYEYLHDRGIEVFREPLSGNGRPDFVILHSSHQRSIADAKVFRKTNGRHNKGDILKGIWQVNKYLRSEIQRLGYVVIYKTCDVDLCFELSTSESSIFPCFNYNNRTIFLITIDIYENPKRKYASQSRATNKSIMIREKDIIKFIEEKDKDIDMSKDEEE